MSSSVKYLRLGAVALILAAIVADAMPDINAGTFYFFDFFGYFTMQANIIAAVTLAIAAFYTARERPVWLEYLRACSVVYLIIVTTVYWILLAPTLVPAVPWANYVVHLASCIIVVVDWLVEGPRRTLPLARWWVVLVYPVVWLVVILIRGATDGWVPYNFLEPADGYASVAVVCGGIVLVGAVLAILTFKATRWRIVTP